MRVFLMTLLVSIVASILLWNFGIAGQIWPAHPLLAATIGATLCGITTQVLMSRDRAMQ